MMGRDGIDTQGKEYLSVGEEPSEGKEPSEGEEPQRGEGASLVIRRTHSLERKYGLCKYSKAR